LVVESSAFLAESAPLVASVDALLQAVIETVTARMAINFFILIFFWMFLVFANLATFFNLPSIFTI